eukprot:scaffold15347_cov68-Cyclotella_meneghiniana.AAC.1
MLNHVNTIKNKIPDGVTHANKQTNLHPPAKNAPDKKYCRCIYSSAIAAAAIIAPSPLSLLSLRLIWMDHGNNGGVDGLILAKLRVRGGREEPATNLRLRR